MRNKFFFKVTGEVCSMMSSSFHNCFKPEDESKKKDSEDRKLTAEELDAIKAEELRIQEEERIADEKREEEENDLIIVNISNRTNDEESYTGVSLAVGGRGTPMLEEIS